MDRQTTKYDSKIPETLEVQTGALESHLTA